MVKMFVRTVVSPIGGLLLVTDSADRVRALDFDDRIGRMSHVLGEHYGCYELVHQADEIDVAAKLHRYFDGEFTALDDVMVATNGSDLQRRIWAELRETEPGTVTSLEDLAQGLKLSDSRAARDVGAAMACNPIEIIVPTHRVVGRDHCGYHINGSTRESLRQRWLLAHERAALEARYVTGDYAPDSMRKCNL